VAEERLRMEESVNVVDEIPEPHRTTIVSVLEDRDPELLRTLWNSAEPTAAALDAIADTFIYAMSEHYGPGHEPDEIGKRIDNALGAFLTRWPNDRLADPS
jgi:hypothetical protein